MMLGKKAAELKNKNFPDLSVSKNAVRGPMLLRFKEQEVTTLMECRHKNLSKTCFLFGGAPVWGWQSDKGLI